MRQVLFRIPIPGPWWNDIPIYGFGTMLVVALFLCVWLAGRRAEKQGIAKEHLQDLAFWIVIAGIIGARVVFMIQFNQPLWKFFHFWEGGLVFYGSLIGGVVGYFLAYFLVMRKHQLSAWKLADVIAPSVALGLCLGRVGCLLNGCCYGNYAPPGVPAISFPMHSFAWKGPVEQGLQTAAGFTLSDQGDGRTVAAVEPGSPAARVGGLRPGDVIIKADGHVIKQYHDLEEYLLVDWPQGKTDLALTVLRDGAEADLPAFAPQTLGLHPTQIYESVSTFLMFLLLTAYYPLRRHDGEVFTLFLLLYPVHRFLNEALRNDTEVVAFGMTLSQNGSILVFLAAVALAIYLVRRPAQYQPLQAAAEKEASTLAKSASRA